MKLIILALAIVAVSCAPAEQAAKEPIPILKFDNEGVNADGSYQWSFESGNSIIAEEKGEIKNADKPEEAAAEVSGSYEYTADDGTKIHVSYIANENGFQPVGDHIPQIPPAIQRALEWIAAHPEPEEKPGKA